MCKCVRESLPGPGRGRSSPSWREAVCRPAGPEGAREGKGGHSEDVPAARRHSDGKGRSHSPGQGSHAISWNRNLAHTRLRLTFGSTQIQRYVLMVANYASNLQLPL